MNMLCNLSKQYGPLVGRVLLALIFVVSGFNKIGGFAGTAGYMASKGLPMADVLLVLTIIIEIGAGLLIMVGWQARWAAVTIFLFLIPVTIIFHPFWGIDPAQQKMEMIMFMKNLSVMGGMLYIVAFGSGPYSLRKDEC
jgi:putative oxidoreductase